MYEMHPLFSTRDNWRLALIERAQQKGAFTKQGMYLALVALGLDASKLEESMKQLDSFAKENDEAALRVLEEKRDKLHEEITKLKVMEQSLRYRTTLTIEQHAYNLSEQLGASSSVNRRATMIQKYLTEHFKLAKDTP